MTCAGKVLRQLANIVLCNGSAEMYLYERMSLHAFVSGTGMHVCYEPVHIRVAHVVTLLCLLQPELVVVKQRHRQWQH
jgi:hypothetical protein